MKNTELIGVILTIIGMVILIIDVKTNSLNWTILSVIGLILVVPGFVLMLKSTIYEHRTKT